MLHFNIHMPNGTEKDAEVLKDCLVEWDEVFEDDDPSLEIEVRELYDHSDDVEDLEKLAISIAENLPGSEFTIDGCIDTSEDNGEYQDFLIAYSQNKLTTRHSCWYIQMYAEDFEDYDDFADEYQDEDGEPRFTEEQYEAFKEGTYYILDSGEGDCVPEVPLDTVYKVDLKK